MSRHRFLSDAVSCFPPLPSGWREERIHDVVDLRTSNVDKKSEEGEKAVRLCNYVDVYKNAKVTMAIDFMEATATDAQIDRFSLRIGDVVITKDSETPDDIGVPALIAETAPDLVCGYHLTILRPNENAVEGGYLLYAVASRLSAYQFYLAANGVTRFGLTYQGTKNLRIALPSVPEQQKIASFLDWKTGQIDELTARKQELLEKLKEKRLAVITQAVTRGLNPAVPLRDSGIPWLGQVPKHWEVRRLKFTASERLKYGANESAESDDPDCPRYIRITDIKEDGTLHEDTFRSLPPELAEPYLLQDGDLLLARSGATVGKTFQYLQTWGEAAYAGYLIRFRVDPTLLSARFAYYFLRSKFYWACINASLIQATIQNFSAEKYADINVPLPPLKEQDQIVAELEKQKAMTDKLEDAISQAIVRLTEYRRALITAATVGKIDVRNVTIPQKPVA
ncbi:MAG TPA: restriction endonuclease subunit S [Solimonas sp.]